MFIGILKCSECGEYIQDDEVFWVQKGDNHEVAVCVKCAPAETEIVQDDSN